MARIHPEFHSSQSLLVTRLGLDQGIFSDDGTGCWCDQCDLRTIGCVENRLGDRYDAGCAIRAPILRIDSLLAGGGGQGKGGRGRHGSKAGIAEIRPLAQTVVGGVGTRQLQSDRGTAGAIAVLRCDRTVQKRCRSEELAVIDTRANRITLAAGIAYGIGRPAEIPPPVAGGEHHGGRILVFYAKSGVVV